MPTFFGGTLCRGDNARRLNLNQLRVFISYDAWLADKAVFRKNLVHLMRTGQHHGLGMMIVVGNNEDLINEEAPQPKAREWASDLVRTIGKEPSLVFWDVSN